MEFNSGFKGLIIQRRFPHLLYRRTDTQLAVCVPTDGRTDIILFFGCYERISKLRKIYELKFVFERETKYVCICLCAWKSERVGFGEGVEARGGEVRKAFIVVQIGNSELFHCRIERVVFLILQERY